MAEKAKYFLKGAGSLLEFFPQPAPPLFSHRGSVTGKHVQARLSDWEIVGHHLRGAMNSAKREIANHGPRK